MRKLYKFEATFHRFDCVDGIFVADESDVEKAMGHKAYFYEAFRKHSNPGITLGPDDLKVMSEDQDFIDKLLVVFGTQSISGWNPVEMILEELPEDE